MVLQSFFSIPGQILLSADFLPAAPSIYKAPEAASRKTSHANLEVQRPVLGRHLPSSVVDPDPPHVFGPPGSASASCYSEIRIRGGFGSVSNCHGSATHPAIVQVGVRFDNLQHIVLKSSTYTLFITINLFKRT
jgi:hypothetical protein